MGGVGGGDMLIFIACCGVASCCQHHYEQLAKVVWGRKKSSVATVVGVFAYMFGWVHVGALLDA